MPYLSNFDVSVNVEKVIYEQLPKIENVHIIILKIKLWQIVSIAIGSFIVSVEK